MTKAIDVIAYLRKRGIYDEWSQQKLAFYCQAWSMVWDDEPIFEEDFEGWRDGPVCRQTYKRSDGNPASITEKHQETIEAVLGFYGKRSSDWLVELTHREPPWLKSREGMSDGEHGSKLIPKEEIRSYYRTLGVAPKCFTEEFMIALEYLVDTPVNDREADATDFVNWLENGVKTNWAVC